jgi:uncharacterized protein with HEPN domain
MAPPDTVRIRHMIEAIEAAQHFVQGRDRRDLDTDRQLLFALTRAVEIVGEAAAKVSSQGRAELPQVPWGTIVGMRNRIVHAYFDVDKDILWTTATQALPALLAHLQSTQAQEEPRHGNRQP